MLNCQPEVADWPLPPQWSTAGKGYLESQWQQGWGIPGLFSQQLEVYVRLEAEG